MHSRYLEKRSRRGVGRTIAVGDIHGCSAALRPLLAVASPGPGDTVVTLGDHIDRGPDSRGIPFTPLCEVEKAIQCALARLDLDELTRRAVADAADRARGRV